MFITGTDTGIGKTYFSMLAINWLISKKFKVAYYKPIQTGNIEETDIFYIKNYCKGVDIFNSILFDNPTSPHIAGEITDGDIEIILNKYNDIKKAYDFVIVEGAGGLFVPLNQKNFMIDLIKRMNIGVVLIANNVLGAINHALLSIESIKTRGIVLYGFVMNNLNSNKKIVNEVDIEIMNDNPKVIEYFSKEKYLGDVSNIDNLMKELMLCMKS